MDALTVAPSFEEDGIAFGGDPIGSRNMQKLLYYEAIQQDTGFEAAVGICHNRGYGAGCVIPPVFAPDFKTSGVVFAVKQIERKERGIDDVVVKSSDKGVNWEDLSVPGVNDIVDIAISTAYADDQTVVVASKRGVFISTDGGSTWEGL
jgi:hypothetical protein